MASTYLVTGSNRGLGLEFVRQLSARGEVVIGTVRDVAKAKEEPEHAATLGAFGAERSCERRCVACKRW
jgi:NAD(P)-dependent dehydrogenase (short-subunit alcohol dehydrogenase family)